MKIVGCMMVFFFVLQKPCKVVKSYIARGLVALDTLLVRLNQVVIQRCYICVAAITFSTLDSPLIMMHFAFMEFAMSWIMENFVTNCACPSLIKGLVIFTHLLLFTFITHHTQLLHLFSILKILITISMLFHSLISNSLTCCKNLVANFAATPLCTKTVDWQGQNQIWLTSPTI